MKQGRLRRLKRFFLLSCALFAASAQAAIPASERAVLDAIYQQTGGAHWVTNSGWGGSTGSECSWYGISCTAAGDHVQQINLTSNNLSGSLPPLANLTQLQDLFLDNNALTGSIPELNGLGQLENVFLGNNQLTGSIPALSGLSKLTQFYALDNQLSGPLPSLAGLTNLQLVCVDFNQLTGSVPSLAGLTSLTTFQAAFNQLSGNFPTLDGLSNLQFIDLGGNKLTGTLPSLSGLTNLRLFAANDNQFTGPIPSISGLALLEQIVVYDNQLTGSIPELSAFAHMQLVDVHQNRLSGSIPSLTGLSNLEQFIASNNQLTGNIPDLSTLTSLDAFQVSGNRLTGGLPSLSNLAKLQSIDVSSNRLRGALPNLSGLTKLAYVTLSDNEFSGTIPALPASPALIVYSIDRNQLTGSIPSLSPPVNLQFFDAHSNALTGSIPSFSGLGQLLSFSAYDNQLTGQIPALTGAPNLTALLVGQNRLTGPAPDLTAMAALQNFSVGGNGLSGDPPFPPATLGGNGSTLCNNAFNHVTSAAWDTAVGGSPWYLGCNATPSVLTLSAVDTTVATGTKTTITAKVTTPGKALVADATGASTGTVTITDDSGKLVCFIKLDATGTGSCDVLFASGSTNNLTGGYSGSPIIAPSSAQFSKTAPIAISGNLDQHGWTGAWYNPATSGQGIILEVYPDTGGAGVGTLGGGWFTFSTTVGGEEQKRWITLQGQVRSDSASANLDLYNATGGNFNAAPVVAADHIGYAVLNFSDCQHGSLSYSIIGGATGNVPLTRIGANVTCDPTNGAGNGTAPGNFLLSGAWYAPSTSGQGVLFEINPVQNVTFAAWYTYAPNGQSIGGGASQRWYTLQIGSANVGASTLSSIGIYSAQGGLFDAPATVTTPQVGTANIAFSNCNALTLNYNFTAGSNAGQSGSVSLQRAGPTPAGCSL